MKQSHSSNSVRALATNVCSAIDALRQNHWWVWFLGLKEECDLGRLECERKSVMLQIVVGGLVDGACLRMDDCVG